MAAAPFSFHCTICFDTFHPDLRYPVVLPCGHTFICNICAKRLDKCMECRTSLFYTPPPIKVPRQPRHLQNNHQMNQGRSTSSSSQPVEGSAPHFSGPSNISRSAGGTIASWRKGRVHPSALGGSSRSSSGRSNRSNCRNQYGQRQQQQQQKPLQQQEPVPLPLPKNILLLSLMETAAHEARAKKALELKAALDLKETTLDLKETTLDLKATEMKDRSLSEDGIICKQQEQQEQEEKQAATNEDAPEGVHHSISFSSGSGADDKETPSGDEFHDDDTWCEGADEDDLVNLGIQIVNSTCGTYAVAHPGGLVLYREVCDANKDESARDAIVAPSSSNDEESSEHEVLKGEDQIKEQNILGISTKENQIENTICLEDAVIGQVLPQKDEDRNCTRLSHDDDDDNGDDEDSEEDEDNLAVLLSFHQSMHTSVASSPLQESLIWRVNRQDGRAHPGAGLLSMTRIGSLMDTDGDFSDVDKDENVDGTSATSASLVVDPVDKIPVAGETIGFGSKVQVVHIDDEGWVKLARNKGFLRIAPGSLQLVKVGIPKDKACQMEGMLHLLRERTKQLQSTKDELGKMEGKLEGVLQKALDNEGVAVIEIAKRVDVTEAETSVENRVSVPVDSYRRADLPVDAFVRASSSRDVGMLSTDLRSVLSTGRRSPGSLPLRQIVASNSFDTALPSRVLASQTITNRKKIDFRTGLSGHQALLSPTAHIPQNVRRNMVRMMSHHKGIGLGAPASSHVQKDRSGAFLNCSQPELRSVQDSNIACGLQQRLSQFQ